MPPSTPYSQLVPAPWKHPSELAMVRDWFYPEHLPRSPFSFAPSHSHADDRRQDAINLVSLWRFRDPKLTHALVCTARLTDAVLHDQPARRARLSDLALRSIYAMNFCRFVNALVDRDVRKSVTATVAGGDDSNVPAGPDAESGSRRSQSSMYGHALALGLPESFVELRHQAIHEEMPSLEVLRSRTREALEWLWGRWWKFNAKGSAEPALSEWEEKYGKKLRADESQTGAAEESLQESSLLCPTCRKRRSSEQEGGRDEEDPSSRDEADENPRNLDRRKQRKRDDSKPDDPLLSPQQSPSRQQQGWTICFSGGLAELGENPTGRQHKGKSPSAMMSMGTTSAPTSATRPSLAT
jgi:Las1-like